MSKYLVNGGGWVGWILNEMAHKRYQLCSLIRRVKIADEVNEQDSDSETEDYEYDMSLPFTKKAKVKINKKNWSLT